jgi:predicted ATP-binding protein involved in virulence
MKINHIRIKNFRGYEDLEVNLNPNFNLFIGDNGSGKTAILEALTVAIGSFFLGIRGANARGFHKKDIRIATFEHSEEYQFPVEVEANGEINQQSISWLRTIDTSVDTDQKRNRTTSKYANSIKSIAFKIENAVRKGESINLPLLVYYATGRLFDVARDTVELSKVKQEKMQISSRFRAYDRSLEAKSTHKKFQNWFRWKELSRIQKGGSDTNLEVVKSTIIKSLPDCVNVYHEFDPDKPQGLKIELEDGRILPFNSLSDGTRNFFAIIADMAYMCITLNPHLKEKALEQTEGVVLIDELDLHLHPEWQRKIITVLRDTFPKLQFIATTHSPFLIQETGEGQLIILKNSKVHKVTSAANLSIEDIAEELQDVDNPQWGKLRQEMFEKARVYYKAVKEGKDTTELKSDLDEAMKPFALDTAFYAIVEQEKIIQEYNNNKK